MNERASGILMPVSSLPGPYGIGLLFPAGPGLCGLAGPGGPDLLADPAAGPHQLRRQPLSVFFQPLRATPISWTCRPWCRRVCWTQRPAARRTLAAIPGRWITAGSTRAACLCCARRSGAGRRWAARRSRGYRAFLTRNAPWLEDYALFMALKARQGGAAWDSWPQPLRMRQPEAPGRRPGRAGRRDGLPPLCPVPVRGAVGRPLKAYANGKGVRIIGDIPIYVALTRRTPGPIRSCSSWTATAAPPGWRGCRRTAFRATGQLWGNPLYDWQAHRAAGYRWWIDRMAASYQRYDVVRIDHFRGFDEYYRVPAGAPDASSGAWQKGPGKELFDALQAALGRRPVIAEDLGYLTDSVRQLVADCGFPGMKVLEFAFDSRDSSSARDYLPHNYPRKLRGLHRHPRQRDGGGLVPQHPARRAGGGLPVPPPGRRRRRAPPLGLCLHRDGLGGPVVHTSPCRTIWAWTTAPGSTTPPPWAKTGAGGWTAQP